MDLGLQEAIAQLQNSSLELNILLFTDGIANEPNLTAIAAVNAKNANIQINHPIEVTLEMLHSVMPSE